MALFACRMIVGFSAWFCSISPVVAQHPWSDGEITESVVYHFGQHFFINDKGAEIDDGAEDTLPGAGEHPAMAPALALDPDAANADVTTGSGDQND